MKRWPAYTLTAIADLTPDEIQSLLNEPETIEFSSYEEYLRWRAKTKS
jgi:hypothetical protein